MPETKEERKTLLEFLDQNNAEIKNNLNKDAYPKELPVCSKCGKTVDQKVVNFCTHPTQQQKFDNKILCRECQKEES